MVKVSNTFKSKALVLHKTKLGESDLIITFLAEDGSLIQAVARGARKSKNLFAARLEVPACVNVLFGCGRNLQYVHEVALIEPYRYMRTDFDKSTCAAVGADLLRRIAQVDLPHPILFNMARVYFETLNTCDTYQKYALCAAFCIKVVSAAGFKPSFTSCVFCGTPIQQNDFASTLFSFEEGGVICSDCVSQAKGEYLNYNVLLWAQYLLMSNFADIAQEEIPLNLSFEELRLCHRWIKCHLNQRLKSLDFLIANPPL